MKFTTLSKTMFGPTLVSLLAGTSSLAFAQEAQDEAKEPTVVMSEIVVTAQKRAQRMQDVPVSMTALTGDALRAAGIRDVKDMQVLIPGLNVNSSSNEVTTTVRIHGVGTVGENPGIESSVGIVIDGVYRPRNGVGFSDLGPLERIEVLRGPQGTLFGKNTSAGVVSIVTEAPEFEFGGRAELTVGNYGALGGSINLTGPIVEEKLAASAFFSHRVRDGFYDVSVGEGPRTELEDADQNYYTGRVQFLFLPTENLNVRLIGDFTHRRDNCCVGVTTIAGATAGIIDALADDEGIVNPAAPFERQTYANQGTEMEVDDKGISAEINWDNDWFGGATLTSVTAFRKWEGFTGTDLDFTSADILVRPVDMNGSVFKQVSQELRLAGKTETLDYLVGAFYAHETLDQVSPNIYGADYEAYLSALLSGGTNPLFFEELTGLPSGSIFPEGAGQVDRFFQTSNSLAFFTNNTYHVNDKLELTVGLRWTKEDKDVLSQYRNINGGGDACQARLDLNASAGTANPLTGYVCLPWADAVFDELDTVQDRSETEWTGTGKVAYHFSDNVMGYVSYSKGYKAGGFNLDRARSAPGVYVENTEIAPETAKSWEVGLKSTMFDRALALNLSGFYQEFTNFQLNFFNGINNTVVAIPGVTAKGVDLDFSWRAPVAGLYFQGGLSYADTTYDDFTPSASGLALLPNNRLSFAPLWSGSLAATYEHYFENDMKAAANINVKYSSKYNTGSDLQLEKEQAAFATIDAKASFGPADERWQLDLWVKNLTDKDYYQVVIGGVLQTGTFHGFVGAPRTFGASIITKF